MSGARLEVRGLDVAYGRVTVLHGVDFDVHAGEIVALLGTNGAGKSTLLRAISGILAPRAGRVLLEGRDVTGTRPAALVRQGIVQMPGGRATFPGLSVAENLRIGAITVARDERAARVDEVIEQFPILRERAGQLAGSLSGGQQQQLALARALIPKPSVLLIDELSLGLAPVIVSELLAVLDRLRRNGMAVVLVEQHVDLALDVADRAYFLERGEVRFEGATADLRGRTDLLRAVFLAGAVD
ncbi:MAG TPA: ABC transporter ATP-binding protein [Acidimicrobiales bacterium]|nr:ABC transporter ATP-binding protein [Acidimicrobiales bacterium]